MSARKPALSSACDHMNDLIDRVEALMQAESDGCVARIEIEGGTLAFERSLWWYPFDGDRCPLRSAPRLVRVIASAHIGELRRRLAKEREEHREHVLSAISALESTLNGDGQ